MRLFKWITVALILSFIGLFIYQNLPTFKSEIPFNLDLYVREPVHWTHYTYTIILASAGIGFLLGLGLMLKPYFNVRRMLAQERQERLAVSKETARQQPAQQQATSQQQPVAGEQPSNDASPAAE